MTSQSGDPEARRWLVEPPGRQEVKFQLTAGDQVEITPEIRQAFDKLLDALNSAEVEGYRDDCTSYKKGCTTDFFFCIPRLKCNVESQYPDCLMYYRCYIAP